MDQRKQASQTTRDGGGGAGGTVNKIISEETMQWINKASSPKLKTKPYVAPFKSGSGNFGSCGTRFDIESEFNRTPGIP